MGHLRRMNTVNLISLVNILSHIHVSRSMHGSRVRTLAMYRIQGRRNIFQSGVANPPHLPSSLIINSMSDAAIEAVMATPATPLPTPMIGQLY